MVRLEEAIEVVKQEVYVNQSKGEYDQFKTALVVALKAMEYRLAIEKSEMRFEKAEKIRKAKRVLEDEGWEVKEVKKGNGQLVVCNLLYWATTEKWHNPKKMVSGKGLKEFIEYLKENEKYL